MPLRLVKDAQRRPQAAVPGRPSAALVLSLTAVIPCGHNEKEGVTSPGRSLPRRGIPRLAILWGVEETNYLKFYLFQVV